MQRRNLLKLLGLTVGAAYLSPLSSKAKPQNHESLGSDAPQWVELSVVDHQVIGLPQYNHFTRARVTIARNSAESYIFDEALKSANVDKTQSYINAQLKSRKIKSYHRELSPDAITYHFEFSSNQDLTTFFKNIGSLDVINFAEFKNFKFQFLFS